MGYYDFSDSEMKAYASNVFIKLLIGVMKKNLSDVRHFLDAELYEEINKKIDNVDDKSERRYRDTLKNFNLYENSIENMYQDNRKRILAVEKRLKVANA